MYALFYKKNTDLLDERPKWHCIKNEDDSIRIFNDKKEVQDYVDDKQHTATLCKYGMPYMIHLPMVF